MKYILLAVIFLLIATPVYAEDSETITVPNIHRQTQPNETTVSKNEITNKGDSVSVSNPVSHPILPPATSTPTMPISTKQAKIIEPSAPTEEPTVVPTTEARQAVQQ